MIFQGKRKLKRKRKEKRKKREKKREKKGETQREEKREKKKGRKEREREENGVSHKNGGSHKMTIATNQILIWCCTIKDRQAEVAAKLIPGGLIDLNNYSTDDIKDTFKRIRHLPDQQDRFHVSTLSTQRVMQLVLWVKDRVRLLQPVEFENGTTSAQFLIAIVTAQQRDEIRKQRKKNTEALATMKIEPPLKSSAGWDTWIVAVTAALSVSYGAKGVPLLYIIRDADAPVFEGTTWEELAVNAAPHTGLDYEADCQNCASLPTQQYRGGIRHTHLHQTHHPTE